MHRSVLYCTHPKTTDTADRPRIALVQTDQEPESVIPQDERSGVLYCTVHAVGMLETKRCGHVSEEPRMCVCVVCYVWEVP